jgi:D-alanyl-D-alanine dipeptidase
MRNETMKGLNVLGWLCVAVIAVAMVSAECNSAKACGGGSLAIQGGCHVQQFAAPVYTQPFVQQFAVQHYAAPIVQRQVIRQQVVVPHRQQIIVQRVVQPRQVQVQRQRTVIRTR